MKKIKEKEFWRKIFQRKEWYDEVNKTKVRFEVIEKYVKGPPVYEPFVITALEAVFFEKPIVAFNVGD